MKRLLVTLSLMSLVCFVQAEPEFLVYDISSVIRGIGERYGDDEFADRGEVRDYWVGQFLYSLSTGEGAIIWRARLTDGRKVQQHLEFDLALLRYNIDFDPARIANIYSLSAGEDPGVYPNPEKIQSVFLVGGNAIEYPINSTDQVNPPMVRLLDGKLSGYYFLLDQTRKSYRYGVLSLRYDRQQTDFANQSLGDYNNDSFVDLNDMIDYWQEIYRNDLWLPVTE